MQDKHVVIVRADEDRDIFINKVKYPKTVYQVEGKGQPEKGDILFDAKRGFPATLATWVLDNWDNLPEYVIFCQANPNDHVVDMVSALDATLTSNFGSYSFGRAMHNQYTTNWVMCNPLLEFLKEFDISLHNSNNISFLGFFYYPGDHFFISKKRILEKSKSFYHKLIELDNQDKFLEILNSFKKPPFFNHDLYLFHPEWRHLSTEERFNNFKKIHQEKKYGSFGYVCEIIYPLLFAEKSLLNLLEKSQSTLCNKLYFDSNQHKYNSSFRFSIYPFNENIETNFINFRKLENNWFDFSCPYYLKWREKLKERVIVESRKSDIDGQITLDYYLHSGYKHISL